jgi:hypothetical protein
MDPRTLAALLLIALLVSPCEAQRRGASRGDRKGGPDSIKAGQMAPDFELPRLDTFLKAESDDEPELELVKLSSFRKKQPVVLIFSSYT